MARRPANVSIYADVIAGLTAPSKKAIPSKYFYDGKGSELFNQICELDEYYPTRTEIALLSEYANDIISTVRPQNIIELGSGLSNKIRLLLDACEQFDIRCTYCPIDICEEALKTTEKELKKYYPWLTINTFATDYTNGIESMQLSQKQNNLILFMGSTIGNFTHDESVGFLSQIKRLINQGSYILIGMDRAKDSDVLHRAYNDEQGVTAQFNLNILEVLNRCMDADFQIDNFEHNAIYNENAEQIEMYLISKKQQYVNFGYDNQQIKLEDGESICTEISRKFSDDKIERLFQESGIQLKRHYIADNKYFSLELGSM